MQGVKGLDGKRKKRMQAENATPNDPKRFKVMEAAMSFAQVFRPFLHHM